jgi:hypothetical protein
MRKPWRPTATGAVASPSSARFVSRSATYWQPAQRQAGRSLAYAEAFIDLLKVSRDFYTHYNPAKKERAAREAGLLLLSLQLRTLIEMALLRELGFTHRAVDAILARARRYQEIEHFKTYVAAES